VPSNDSDILKDSKILNEKSSRFEIENDIFFSTPEERALKATSTLDVLNRSKIVDPTDNGNISGKKTKR
jgi:hypothetical protein